MATEYKNTNQTFGEVKEEIDYKDFVSWNTISYFKNMGGIMIRPVVSIQKLLISLLRKTVEKKYQSFKEGTVIKFNAQQIDEIFFHLDHGQAYSTWRKKESGALSVWISFIDMEKYTLPNSKAVVENVKSLKIKVTNSKDSSQNREFIFSPFEYQFVLDLLKEFRNEVVKRYIVHE